MKLIPEVITFLFNLQLGNVFLNNLLRSYFKNLYKFTDVIIQPIRGTKSLHIECIIFLYVDPEIFASQAPEFGVFRSFVVTSAINQLYFLPNKVCAYEIYLRAICSRSGSLRTRSIKNRTRVIDSKYLVF